MDTATKPIIKMNNDMVSQDELEFAKDLSMQFLREGQRLDIDPPIYCAALGAAWLNLWLGSGGTVDEWLEACNAIAVKTGD